MGMAIDIEKKVPVIANNQGGMSGPAIKPLALLKVHEVYQVSHKHRVPIIGQGGIVSASDAIEFLLAGASAVGIGTGLFYDPLMCKEVNQGIAEYIGRHDFCSVSDITGKLELSD